MGIIFNQRYTMIKSYVIPYRIIKFYQLKFCKLSKMEIRIMIKENKVSLWLGFYENADDFKNYIKVSYDEDGNYIPSNFQASYAIKSYDLDAIESDWIL